MKQYRLVATGLVLGCFIMIGCKKNYDAGIQTTITGQIMEYASGEPLEHVQVKVAEYERGSGFIAPTFLRAIIDSAYSDATGHYSITFTTTGQGSEYRLLQVGSSRIKSFGDNEYKIAIGKNAVVNFTPVLLHTIKAFIHIEDYPNPPLAINVGPFGGEQLFYGRPLDTMTYFDAIANNDNGFYYRVTDLDTPTLFNYQNKIVRFDGLSDTISIHLSIDPKSFTR